jgi:GMP synthase-like glutamine amidotransferase
MLSTPTNHNYKIFKNTSLFFFTRINDNDIMFFLIKDQKGNLFYPFKTPIYKYDNSAPYALARLLTNNFYGLFSKYTIHKMTKGSEIIKEDLLIKSERTNFWYSKNFWEWLDRLSHTKCFQYEDEEELLISYFIEMPMIHIDKLNKNVSMLGINLEFGYFNISYIDCMENKIKNIIEKVIERKYLSKFTTAPEISTSQNTYIVLSCKPYSSSKDQAGIFHFPALFQSLYKRSGETWLYYTASVDGFPPDDVLKQTKAIIIPGSQVSVYDNYEYLRKTEKFIQYVTQNHTHIKFLGICFGAQIIAEVFGGKVKSRKGGFFTGVERLTIMEQLWNYDFAKNTELTSKKYVEVMKYHGDEITTLPLGFHHIAKSHSCEYEILVSDNAKLLLIQGHPEYDCYFEYGKSVGSLLLKSNTEYSIKNLELFERTYFKRRNLRDYEMHDLRKLCFNFLKL